MPQRWRCSEMVWEALREWGSWGGGLPSPLRVLGFSSSGEGASPCPSPSPNPSSHPPKFRGQSLTRLGLSWRQEQTHEQKQDP